MKARRPNPSIALIKVIDVIESCETTGQIQVAKRMCEQFYLLFPTHTYREADEELAELINEQETTIQLNKLYRVNVQG